MTTGATKYATFSGPEPLISKATHTAKALLVVMPGVLMDAQKGFAPIIPALMEGCDTAKFTADIMYVDYPGDRIDWHELVAQVAFKLEKLENSGKYHVIVPIAASFSGLVINQAYSALGTPPRTLTRRPILIDSPFGATFPKGGGLVARVASKLDFSPKMAGRLNKNDQRFTGKMNLPKARNIGNAGDFAALTGDEATTYPEYIEWVTAKAREGLSGQKPTMFASMIGAMADFHFVPFPKDVHPVYLACTDVDVPDNWEVAEEEVLKGVTDAEGNLPVERPKNDTVSQPKAVDKWIEACGPEIKVIAVRSTHCGFMERPVAWRHAIVSAIKQSLSR